MTHSPIEDGVIYVHILTFYLKLKLSNKHFEKVDLTFFKSGMLLWLFKQYKECKHDWFVGLLRRIHNLELTVQA